MSLPTTAIGFSPSTPAAPAGDQNTIPQGDNGTPLEKFSQYPQRATGALFGTVKPDGTSINIAGGVLSAVITPSTIQRESFTYALDTGAANAYAVTLSPAPTIIAGSEIVFIALHANTGASTVSVNGVSYPLKKNGAIALAGGEIASLQIITAKCDGTNFQISQGATGATGATGPAGTPSVTTKGDLQGFSTVAARVPVGADGTVLTADSTQTLGVKYATPAAASLYFGRGNATATAGNNVITLGSTPVTASAVSVFVAGSILPSSAYSISGAVVSLTSALSAGNVVVVTWVTTNSTPGGISLSTAGGLFLGFAGWAMNEGSGLILHDSIGSNDATINTGASVTWQSNAGFPGTTTLWAGTGNALASSATLTNFDGTTPFSIAVWFKVASLSSDFSLLSTLKTGTLQGWEIGYSTGLGLPYFFLINNYPSNALGVQGPALTAGTLTYMVATYDGSRTAAGVKIYINSAVGGASFSNSLSATAANGLPVEFGARPAGGNELSGVMAFAEIFNIVLTATQVAAFYAAGPQLN
jgi:hypothetical protein